MPAPTEVHVHIPVRIRLGAGELASSEDLGELLAELVAGRLAQARREVPGPAGNDAVVVHVPRLVWTGAGAPEVPVPERARIEARIQAAIARALHRAGLVGTMRPGAARAWAEGAPEAADTVQASAQHWLTGSELAWDVFSENDPAYWDSLRAAVLTRLEGQDVRYVGTLFRQQQAGRTVLMLALHQREAGNWRTLALVPMVDFSFTSRGRRLAGRELRLPAEGHYALVLLARGRSGEALNRLRGAYRKHARARLAETGEDAETRARLDAEVEQISEELLRQALAADFGALLELRGPGGAIPIPVASGLAGRLPSWDIPVLPLAHRAAAEARQGTPGLDTPFEGEPSLEELGREGGLLARLIREIAARLGIAQGRYPAAFCLHAAKVLAGRAKQAASQATTDKGRLAAPAVPGQGSLGSADFSPEPSPALQQLRHLAGVVPLLDRLEHAILEVSGQRLGGHWRYHFLGAAERTIAWATGWLYIQACQVTLLQLLASSAEQINARLERFDEYSKAFQLLVTTVLAHQGELLSLREQLNQALLLRGEAEGSVARGVLDVWRQVRQAPALVSTVLELVETTGELPNVSSLAPQWAESQRALLLAMSPASLLLPGAGSTDGTGRGGEIVRRADGSVGIRDRKGRAWSMDELQQAIVFQQRMIESIDPLVAQLWNLSAEIRLLADNPEAIPGRLKKQLEDMKEHNREFTRKARESAEFALEMGSIQRTLEPSEVPGLRYQLRGIHLLAHQALGDAFEGNRFYRTALNNLFGRQEGWEDFVHLGEFVSVTVLSVVCPPVGIALGLATAGYELGKARELERFYGAFIDPELVISRAEVELKLFLAQLGLALSIIPDAGQIVGAAMRGVRTVGREGVLRGSRMFAREATDRLLAEASGRLKAGLGKALVKEVLTGELLNRVVSVLLEPVIAQILLDLEPPGSGG